MAGLSRRFGRACAGWLVFWTCAALGASAPTVDYTSPIDFFTNVAARLLKSELELDLNRLQLYPTNQYTPAVHRLLQVTANLYAAATNRAQTEYPDLPSVFRPVFLTTESGAVYIQGYAEVTNADLVQAPPPLHVLSDTNDRPVQPFDLVSGVPLIIGARKGLPSFNELAMQTELQVIRRLQFRRPDGLNPEGYMWPVNETNVMYTLSISNVLGLEAWNSYSNAYPRDLELRAAVETTLVLTNEFNEVLLSNRVCCQPPAGVILSAANQWIGYNPAKVTQVPYSFLLPILTNFFFLSNATYVEATRQFVPETAVFERYPGPSRFVVPHWWVQLRTRVQFSLVDVPARRLVDYASLESVADPLDVTETLGRNHPNDLPVGSDGKPFLPDSTPGGQWCTNRWPSLDDPGFPTYGILNQIIVCLGNLQPLDWWGFISSFPAGLDEKGAIDWFRVQFDYGPIYYPNVAYSKTNAFLAPLNPVRRIYLFTSWQVNDPLVHTLSSDVQDAGRTNSWDFNTSPSTIDNLGSVNARYEPWSGSPDQSAFTETQYDFTVKDPRVFLSQDWDFPTNRTGGLEWLGRVHRGTPWQTIYLKAAAASPATWQHWLGLKDPLEALRLHPTNDWRLVSRLAPWLGTNTPPNLLSINQPEAEAWASALDGLVVLTNTSSEVDLGRISVRRNPQFASLTLSAGSPQAQSLFDTIAGARAAAPGGAFQQMAEFLAIPALSVASPFLNTNGTGIRQFGLTDAAYEAIPAQLLGRLRPDSLGSLRLTDGTLWLQFSGQEPYAYVLERSSDLVHWTAVATNFPNRGFIQFQDSPGPAPRFYRSVLAP